MSNDSLSREREYTWRQFQEGQKRLNDAIKAMIKGENHTPIWMLRADLDKHIENIENICFETEYRATI